MARTDMSLVSSEDVQGTDVFSPDGTKVGEIDHLMLEKRAGRVTYAVMSFGGFLGLGNSHFPLPWAALRYNTELGGYQTNVTEAQLQNAPQFADGSWSNRQWETQVHNHYGVQPYWN
jgi:sporulation protein YlmC with PRC-barrel domain